MESNRRIVKPSGYTHLKNGRPHCFSVNCLLSKQIELNLERKNVIGSGGSGEAEIDLTK